MRSLSKVMLGLFLLGLTWPTAAQEAQDKEARAIIDKALKAHGGLDKLAKHPAAHVKAKGKMDFMNLKFTIEIHSQDPDKVRSSVDLDLNGKNFNVVNVFDGKKAWESLMGQTKEIKDEKKLEKQKNDAYIQHVTGLVPLAAKGFELSLLGEVKVKDQDTVGVRVTAKDKPDVNLFFDKKTSRLVKTESRTTDPFTDNEVNQEVFLIDYKEMNGINEPTKLIIHYDGKFFMELEITESRRLETLDKALFTQP